MSRTNYLQTASAYAIALVHDDSVREEAEEWFTANPLYSLREVGRTGLIDAGAPSAHVYRISYRAKKANRNDLARRFEAAFGDARYAVVERYASITDKVPYATAV